MKLGRILIKISMGKSMSTAKQVGRTVAANVTKESAVQPKLNQKIAHKVQSMPTEPSSNYIEKMNTLDKGFNDRLKQVFVTSVNKNPSMDLPKDRTMPKDRNTSFAQDPHTQQIDVKKPNSLLVDDLKMLLINYKENPEKWTLDYIAARYEISKELAEKVVANYSTLQTYHANSPSESDKYLHESEPVERIRYNTPIKKTEDIVSVGTKRKWKTLKEELDSYK